jgi:hypothetical protein
MTVIAMSRPEIDRVHVLRDVAADRISVREAAQLLRITRRQVFRLLKAYHAGGPAALVPSCRRSPRHRTLVGADRARDAGDTRPLIRVAEANSTIDPALPKHKRQA